MNDISGFIRIIPKAELHVHIEGTFEPEQMFEFAVRNNIKTPYKSVEELRNAYQFKNLQEFLDIYYLGAASLKTEKDFYDLTSTYLIKAEEQNIIHTEIFFDPQTHLANNVPFPVFFNGIYNAALDAKKNNGINTKLIMCFLRHLDEKSAFETLEQSLEYKEKIVAIGLDSAEKGNPPEKFSRVFDKARELGFKTVAHAGEEGPSDYIRSAIKLLNVSRIDHGNRSKGDESLLEEIAEKRIPLTLCPLSNLKLGVVKDLKEHPLKLFLEKNILATINSDDPAYFGGYLIENFIAIQQALNLGREDIITLAKNSFEASFITKQEKESYAKLLDEFVLQSTKK